MQNLLRRMLLAKTGALRLPECELACRPTQPGGLRCRDTLDDYACEYKDDAYPTLKESVVSFSYHLFLLVALHISQAMSSLLRGHQARP